MKVVITKILPLKPSRLGGTYRRVFFKDDSGTSFRLDVWDRNRDSFRFNEFLEIGSVFENVKILEGRQKIIDGKCDFKYMGRRQGKRPIPKSQGKLF